MAAHFVPLAGGASVSNPAIPSTSAGFFHPGQRHVGGLGAPPAMLALASDRLSTNIACGLTRRINARGESDAETPEGCCACSHYSHGKRSPIEIKRALTDAVTKAVTVALDLPPEWVTIIIDEVERENWADYN